MSMPALLSHFGITAARYVTTGGRIVFDGVTRAGSTYSHATFGQVTPVRAHTFHGGEDRADDPPCRSCLGWKMTNELATHIKAMEAAFPAFAYLPPEGDLAPRWIGEIDTGRGRFRVKIALRRDRSLPDVTVLGGPRLGVHAGRWWTPSPHLYLNGNLCVAGAADWDVREHTAATVTSWAAHWLAAYTEWRFSRRWPVEGVRPVA